MKKSFLTRIFEMIPGLFAWFAITLPVWGAFLFPSILINFIILVNVFALYKSISAVAYFIIGYIKIRNDENENWMANLEQLNNISSSIDTIKEEITILKTNELKINTLPSFYNKIPKFLRSILIKLQKKKLINFLKKRKKELIKIDTDILNWQELKHIIIIPFWQEPESVLIRSIECLANQTLPSKQIVVVLGAEERHKPALEMANKLREKYKDKFFDIWVNNHVLVEDEVVGKAANMASAGKYALSKIKELGWNKDYVTITSCDSDTQFDPQYFAYFSHLFCTNEKRYTRFFAAPMAYYANIWKVPFYIRIANTVFTINNIGTTIRTDKFIQVSSYSFSWRLLEDIDFWSVEIIPEDFHMFFKALFLHGNNVMTVPIYLKNLSDAAESVGHPSSIKNQYEQVKRWAWGNSDHGWMIKSWLRSSTKSLYTLYRVAHTIFDHLTWSVTSFLLVFGTNIPLIINRDLAGTVFGSNSPRITSTLMTIATILFFSVLILDSKLKPERKIKPTLPKRFLELLQWITLPLITFIFGAIPGLDAQTRLLFGKYLEYRLTEKH